MGFPINLGGLWRPKMPGKSICSGAFNLPAALLLDPARGHKFVIRNHDKKGNQNAPDYDLLLFVEDKSVQTPAGNSFDDLPQDVPAGVDEEVPF
jgi:hypothetical protein